MPRDIEVIIEKRVDDSWELVLPMLKNDSFNYEDPKQNWLNDSMYINEYFPQAIYDDYDQTLWVLFGVEGRLSSNARSLPTDSCEEIREYHKSYGDEAFQEHWISCKEFVENTKIFSGIGTQADDLAAKIRELGDLDEMRLILWFSQ